MGDICNAFDMRSGILAVLGYLSVLRGEWFVVELHSLDDKRIGYNYLCEHLFRWLPTASTT